MKYNVGDYIPNLHCESFVDPSTGRIRVRPLSGQGLPTTLVIECSKEEREKHPVGTIFVSDDVKVCIKPDGRPYLRARNQKIYKV